MTIAPESGLAAASAGRKTWSRRAWVLTLLAAVAGIASGIVAIVLDGAPRASFAAASIVCLATMAYCAATVWLETSHNPPIDLEAPLPEPPVPQSQVTLVYDPSKPPNNSTNEKANFFV
jgi:hypothetical protein